MRRRIDIERVECYNFSVTMLLMFLNLYINPFRYKGYYWDESCKMYYLQSRFYDPEIMRFISADDIRFINPSSIGGLNLFAYCLNNPVMMADTIGNVPFFIITGAIGAVIGGFIGGIHAHQSGGRWWQGALKGAAIGAVIGATGGALWAGAATGSFTAGKFAVTQGTLNVYGMFKTGGVVSAGYMMMDNIGHAIKPFTHVFWSGGEIAKEGGKHLANDVGGRTLEMTRLGIYLSKKGNSISFDAWRFASANFAHQVAKGGTVFSVQNVNGVFMQGAWATVEFPILAQKFVNIVWEIIGGL